MTDLEKFIELYKGFGIECAIYEEDGNKIILAFKTNPPTNHHSFGDSYPHFYTEIIFDKDGKYISQSFLE